METVTTWNVPSLDELLTTSAAHHHKICPRQVLGVRIGLLAGRLLEIPLPQPEKRLLAIVETDGCFVDGLSAATGCYVGRRTLRVEDYGKTAATFIDTLTEQAIRIAPYNNVRELAWEYAPSARNKWEAQLIGYQHIPDKLLFHWQWVELTVPVKQIIFRTESLRRLMKASIRSAQYCVGIFKLGSYDILEPFHEGCG